jgi:hypothetical protein
MFEPCAVVAKEIFRSDGITWEREVRFDVQGSDVDH